MAVKRQEIKEELTQISQRVGEKLSELFGDHQREVNFSALNLFLVLFHKHIRFKADTPEWPGRDRLVISNLKVVPSLFAVLADVGFISWKEFQDLVMTLPKFFGNRNIALVGYPGVDFITDDPHHGMFFSLGQAQVGRQSRSDFRVYHVLSDKRTVTMQDALLTASSAKMKNLTSIIPFVERHERSATTHFWFSMGWQPEESRFDDVASIYNGLKRISSVSDKPQVLLG